MKKRSKQSKPRRKRGSLSREEIMTASLKIIKEKGLEELSMRSIAKELKCSVASPYAHFKNQNEIIRAILIEGEKKLTIDLKLARASHIDVADQIKAIANAYWNFCIENRDLHKLMFSQSQHQNFILPTSYLVFLRTILEGIKKKKINVSHKKLHAILKTLWAWMYGVLVLEMTGHFQKVKFDYDPLQEGILIFQSLLEKLENN